MMTDTNDILSFVLQRRENDHFQSTLAIEVFFPSSLNVFTPKHKMKLKGNQDIYIREHGLNSWQAVRQSLPRYYTLIPDETVSQLNWSR